MLCHILLWKSQQQVHEGLWHKQRICTVIYHSLPKEWRSLITVKYLCVICMARREQDSSTWVLVWPYKTKVWRQNSTILRGYGQYHSSCKIWIHLCRHCRGCWEKIDGLLFIGKNKKVRWKNNERVRRAEN